MIDAYCHTGLPRFGSADDGLAVADLFGIERSVLVLGPMVPDCRTLFDGMAKFGDRIRGVGIPFGASREQQIEMTELQLRVGVMGMRLQGSELLPEILDRVGECGRWIYAIGLRSGSDIAQTLLDWLERYSVGRIAAPHFLRPNAGRIEGALRDLILHPRFFPIFSRHGGLGSQEPYPHEDMRPWVEQVVDLAGWDRVMWGSEYPVLCWRDETMPGCQTWLSELLGDDDRMVGFWGENARREIFDHPAPEREAVVIPDWVDVQFDRSRTVPVFDYGGLELSMDLYERLHRVYVDRLKEDASLTFGAFVVDLLAENM